MKRKTVGILTLPLHNNYGGNLQAYALLHFIKKMGYQPTLIKLQPLAISLKKKFEIIFKQLVKKFLFFDNSIGNPLMIVMPESEYRIISKNSRRFIEKYIQPQTSDIVGIKGWENYDKSPFNFFLIGSDQVWRKAYAGEYIDVFFMKIPTINNVKKIAYAASFGTEKWQFTNKETQKYASLLKQFDSVSVREDSAVELCRDKMGLNVEQLVDPTLLLKKEDYLRVISAEKTKKPEGELCVYLLDRTVERNKIVEKLKNHLKLRPFSATASSTNKIDNIENRIYPPVAQWLRDFADSKFIITDSFHGCVFSIIFYKPFLVIGNKIRGIARFESLMKTFNLEDRLINSFSELKDKKISLYIDWKNIEYKLGVERERSENFLKRSLITT